MRDEKLKSQIESLFKKLDFIGHDYIYKYLSEGRCQKRGSADYLIKKNMVKATIVELNNILHTHHKKDKGEIILMLGQIGRGMEDGIDLLEFLPGREDGYWDYAHKVYRKNVLNVLDNLRSFYFKEILKYPIERVRARYYSLGDEE